MYSLIHAMYVCKVRHRAKLFLPSLTAHMLLPHPLRVNCNETFSMFLEELLFAIILFFLIHMSHI